MVDFRLDRRAVLAGLGALTFLPQIARAKDYIDLDWSDLLPDGQIAISPMLDESE